MDGVATQWYSLGLQLLGNYSMLDRIKSNCEGDTECCCNEMFKKWLETKPDASWDQLIAALKEVELITTATQVTTRFTITPKKPGNYVVLYLSCL